MAAAAENLAAAGTRLACAAADVKTARELLGEVSLRLGEATEDAFAEIVAMQTRVVFARERLEDS
ncbi:MAG: hypothetical protein ACRCYU_22995 [Nocardioides sp.]